MNELYELRRLHGEYAAEVEAWATAHPGMTRDRIAELRIELEGGAAPLASQPDATSPAASSGAADQADGADRATSSNRRTDASRPARVQHTDQRIHVEFDGQDYQLVVSVAPDQPGHLYVRPLVGGPRRLAPASALKLLGFVGG
jgi:ParB family chromosome partitioning protein